MKRCPECRRDYHDDSLMYCLEDGVALIQGSVPSPDEPQTAILSEPGAIATGFRDSDVTRTQIHTTAAEPQRSDSDSTKGQSLSAHRASKPLLAVAAVAVILLGGYFGYQYLDSNSVLINSIAVMPFVNEGGNSELDYLSDGMTDTLISNLSHLPNLNVKAHSSVFRYKGKETSPQTIGKDLNVQAILNGRVAQLGDQLTLTVELVDVRTENVIWSDQYKRRQVDLVTLQSEIARDVSAKLRTKLSGAEVQNVAKTYTANPEAYQLYLKGLYYWNKRTGETLKTSIDYFDQAIQKDPLFAQAYAGMALAYVLLPEYSVSSPAESIPKGKAAALKALELDETLAEAHSALAHALFTFDRNLPESNRRFQRAIELNPNYATAHQWYADNLVVMGRFDESIAEGKRAVELDPLSLIVNLELGSNSIYAGQNEVAVAALNKAMALDQNWYLPHLILCQAYDQTGQFAEAVVRCQRARELDDDPVVLAYLGHVYGVSGKKDEAVKLLGQLNDIAKQRYVSAFSFALVYAGLGDKDQAIQWLERSLQDQAWEILYVNVDSRFNNLHAQPRFRDLLQKVGLPE